MMLSAVSRAPKRVWCHRRQREMQTGAINFATKVAKQQRSYRTIDQITEDRGHRQRPEMGANHRKSEARQHRAGFDHADFVELQFLLHQRAELLPVGITTNASDNVLINGASPGCSARRR